MRRHRINEHGQNKRALRCRECKKVFATTSHLAYHQTTEHRRLRISYVLWTNLRIDFFQVRLLRSCFQQCSTPLRPPKGRSWRRRETLGQVGCSGQPATQSRAAIPQRTYAGSVWFPPWQSYRPIFCSREPQSGRGLEQLSVLRRTLSLFPMNTLKAPERPLSALSGTDDRSASSVEESDEEYACETCGIVVSFEEDHFACDC